MAQRALASEASQCRTEQGHAMTSPMLPHEHQAVMRRVLTMGRSGDPAALPGLIAMLSVPSNEVQRLAASAMPVSCHLRRVTR